MLRRIKKKTKRFLGSADTVKVLDHPGMPFSELILLEVDLGFFLFETLISGFCWEPLNESLGDNVL